MSDKLVKAEFLDEILAESAIGRLEILGIPPADISKTSSAGKEGVTVSARVEDRLAEKASLILKTK